MGVGFRLRGTATKQQGPWSQRQPSPALPDMKWRAGCLNGLRAFLSKGAVELLCAPRGAFPVPLQTAAPRSSVGAVGETGPRCCAAHLGSGGIAGAWAKKAFARPVLLPQEGEHFGGGFQAPATPSNAEGPREPEASQARFARRPAAGSLRKRLALLS